MITFENAMTIFLSEYPQSYPPSFCFSNQEHNDRGLERGRLVLKPLFYPSVSFNAFLEQLFFPTLLCACALLTSTYIIYIYIYIYLYIYNIYIYNIYIIYIYVYIIHIYIIYIYNIYIIYIYVGFRKKKL